MDSDLKAKPKVTIKDEETFYTRVYDDAVTKKTQVDKTIIEQTCQVGGGRVESLGRVFDSGGEGDPAASHHASYTAALNAIHQQRSRAEQRYSSLVANILTHEPDLKAQENRREEGAAIQERQKLESDALEEHIQRLQEKIHKTRSATAATAEKVQTYSTYREYVEGSVETFGSEASTVEGVCGRFRDLLNLRLQLLLKVNHASLQLQQSRRQLLMFVQGEKEREGQALLVLYQGRTAAWASSRKLGEMEAKLAALQAASTHTHTHLTRVRLALANIYSVARAYQRSLLPLGPRAPSSVVLKRLHNFLLDAITVTTTARNALQPESMRPSAPSLAEKAARKDALTQKVAVGKPTDIAGTKPVASGNEESKEKDDGGKGIADKRVASGKGRKESAGRKGGDAEGKTPIQSERAKSATAAKKEISINKPQPLPTKKLME
ncbi:hypothetical protein SK128_005730 [Halocaridina rubra]|uniref:DUF4200 domain-containing protein n=1 Tax=Halocaridina rubra TaxID=373956 RepID=A0AAN8XBT6_HALRR